MYMIYNDNHDDDHHPTVFLLKLDYDLRPCPERHIIYINYLRFIDSTQGGEKKESPESHDPLRYFLQQQQQQQLSLLRQHTVYLSGAVSEEDGAYSLRAESLAKNYPLTPTSGIRVILRRAKKSK